MASASNLKVVKIIFEGNHSIHNSQLLSIIKTEKGKEFNNKFLRFDRTLIQNYYQTKGFLDVWVESDFKRNGNKITVSYSISEGKQYFLGKLTLDSVRLVSPEHFREDFNIKNGEVFNRQLIEEGMNKVEGFYFNHGKPYVVLNEQETIVDSLVNVTVTVQENETVYITDIDYQGLQKAKSFLIRRELEVKKGQEYSKQLIEKSQKNVYSTGLFDYVGMRLEPLDSARTKVRLLVQVVEKKSQWVGLRFGVAYEQRTVYGGTFDFTMEYGNRDIFGTARTLTLTAIPSISYDFDRNNIINPKNQVSLTFVEPWIGYTRTPGIAQISYYQVRPVNSVNYNNFMSSLQVKHDFSNFWSTSGILAFNKIRVLQNQPLDSTFFAQTKGQDLIYSLTGNFTRDKRDNYMVPTRGYLLENSIKLVYSVSRTDFEGSKSLNRFIKVIAQWNRYQPFPWKREWVLATRIRGGNIFEFGKLGQIPITERFYLGGASSVRGYREQLLGPVTYSSDNTPIAVGGKLMVLGNLEVRIPLFWLFWGETFIDAGNVWAQSSYFKIADIKGSSGFGLAIVTPFGPVRFDYGFKLRRAKNESPGEFHMGISFAF